MRLSPAEITARTGRPVERQQLIARAAAVMRHDGAGRIDHTHELRHHMIRRDRRFLGVQLGFPPLQPGGAFGGDLGGGGAVGQLAAEALLHRDDQIGQGQARVAEKRDLGLMLLMQVAGVVGGVNDGHALGQRRRGQRVAVQAGADAQDQVGLCVKEQPAGTAERVAARADGQRMIFREGAFAIYRRHHRRLQQFGQLHQLIGGFGIQNALPGQDHRAFCRHQQLRGVVHIARVRARDAGPHRAVIDRVAADFHVHQVARHLHHHRSQPPILQRAKRSAHHIDGRSGEHDLLDLLGDRGIGYLRAERRKHLRLIARLRQRQEQHRHGIGVGGGNAGERIFRARAVLHREHPGRLAVGDAGIAVGHVDAHPFLPADHRADAGGNRVLDDRGRREAEQGVYPLPLEDFDDGIGCSHGGTLPVDVCATLGGGRGRGQAAGGNRVRTKVVGSSARLIVIAGLDPATQASTAGGGLPDQVRQ